MSANFVHRELIKEAIDLLGSQQALADAINSVFDDNLQQPHIWKWANTSVSLPVERAMQIEVVTKGKIEAKKLLPNNRLLKMVSIFSKSKPPRKTLRGIQP